jgi:2-dehydro-3-deoxyphosphogluconate aldolase/(4S)-4-hydroxy-2-oxoglutarate aldolase
MKVMGEPFESRLWKQLSATAVVAVLVVDRAEDAVPLARALVEGGVRAMELTLRTPAAIEALEAIRAEVPEMTAGIGTILTVEQVRQVKEAGAAFGVSPGCNPRVVRAAAEAGLSFAPGIATPTDIEAALELGCRLLKLFPAEPIGGLPYLKSAAAPYLHLGVQFIPLGGIGPANAGAWLADPLIAAVGGSWLAPRELIKSGRWERIRTNAAEAMRIAREARGEPTRA